MFFITSKSGLTRFVKLFGKSYPQVPVIGIGGISNANDALEFFMAGASAIQIGTINFTNPRAGIEIRL
jgi:dihydroorotate dehydrogenase